MLPFFHSLVPKDEAHSKAGMKKQINIAWLVFSLWYLGVERIRKGKLKSTMWKNDLTQKDGKCLPLFNSGCVGVFPSSSSSGSFLKTQNKKVNFLCDITEHNANVN